MKLAAALDRVVRVTGLDYFYRMAIKRPEPRPLRWLPALLVFVYPVGYIVWVKAMAQHDLFVLVAAGPIIFGILFMMPMALRWFGPRLIGEPDNPLDERERIIRDRAGNLSGMLISFTAMVGCFYFAYASAVNSWRPHTVYEWAMLGMALQGTYFALPVLVASWLQPRLNAER